MKSIRFKKANLKVWGIRLIILFVLLCFIEIGLRISGQIPGVFTLDFVPVEQFKETPYLYSDSLGINRLIDNGETMIYNRNSDGFRSLFEFDQESIDSIRAAGQKVIFFIGDSYIEGCCLDDYSKSFADIIGQNETVSIFNFGIGGTDPVQYKLLAQHYLDHLKPDLVVFSIFLGNDILFYERTHQPGYPISYQIEGVNWLPGEMPHHLAQAENVAYKNALEGYSSFVKHYTLKGDTRNVFEQLLGLSALGTKLYLGSSLFFKHLSWMNKRPPQVCRLEQDLDECVKPCKKSGTPYLILGIPSVIDIKKNRNLEKEYSEYFGVHQAHFISPDLLEESDYDGESIGNHFTENGHRKYADYLYPILKEKLELN